MNKRVKQYIEAYVDLIESNPKLFIETAIPHVTYSETNTLIKVLKDAGVDIEQHVHEVLREAIKYNLPAYRETSVLQLAFDIPPLGVTLKNMKELIMEVAIENGYTLEGPSGKEIIVK